MELCMLCPYITLTPPISHLPLSFLVFVVLFLNFFNLCTNWYQMEDIDVLWCSLLFPKFKVLTFLFWMKFSHWFFKSHKVESLGQCENSPLGVMTLKWFVTVLQTEQRGLGIISCKDDADFHLFKNLARIQAIVILHKPKYLCHIYGC